MLTERQKLILHAIIDDYIRSAEPVGSRTISKRHNIGYSPATVRNEMSDLEELGFLEQPHTSAGRIPSHLGYRYYVDHLMHLDQYDRQDELEAAKQFLREKLQQAQEIAQQVTSILSSLTSYTVIALGADIFHQRFKHLQIVPLHDNKAAAIIVTNSGHVENKIVTIPGHVSREDMERFVNLVNANLTGIPMLKLKSRLKNQLQAELQKYVAHYKELLDVLGELTVIYRDDKVHLSGLTNILNQPEFRDVEKAKNIFDLFEDANTMINQVFAETPDGLQVRIGTENHVEAMKHCSFITASYSVNGQTVSTIGILGPTRMEYKKVISLLDLVLKQIAAMMEAD